MEKKSKMKSWQIITLAVLFIITVVLIIAVNVLKQKNPVTAANKAPEATPAVSVELIGLNEEEKATQPIVVPPSPRPSVDVTDVTEQTNGVTVITDVNGNQTIDRDWGGSDESTKPTTGVPDTSVVASPSPSESTNTESKPSPSAPASATPSKSPSGGSSSASSTPKNGATKTENGVDYIYVEGFGWIVNDHGGSTNTQGTGPGASGEHIGNFG